MLGNSLIIQFSELTREWLRRRWAELCALCALQFACYTYFLTIPLLSNHTFPNVWIYNYPSWKTASEGRWFADLIILFQGSSGVQSFQFFCVVILQAVNGLLLADLLRINKQKTASCWLEHSVYSHCFQIIIPLPAIILLLSLGIHFVW
jgi:uncharacterized RDD family membrane protein YckC